MDVTDSTDVVKISVGAYTLGSLKDLNITITKDEIGANLSDNETDISPVSDKDYAIPIYLMITVSALYILFFVLGLIGNGLVVFVICVNSHMRNSTNLFLLNLSVADMLVLVICMPAALTEFYSKDVWMLGDFMCKAVPYLENSVANASVLTILCISIERYYAICYPMKVKSRCINANTGRAILFVWMCALMVASPFLAMSNTEQATFYDGSTVIVCRTAINSLVKQCYVVILMVMLFVVPLCAVAGLYTVIIIRMRMSSRNITIQRHLMLSSMTYSRLQNSRQQVIYMLIAIVILFVICLMPIRVVTLWYIFSSDHHKTSLGLEGYLNLVCFARVMFYMNSAVNPILYNVMSSRFRESFRRAVFRQYRGPRRGSTASTLYSMVYTRDNSMAFRRRSCDSIMLQMATSKHRHNSETSVDRESRCHFLVRRSSLSSCTAQEHCMNGHKSLLRADKHSNKQTAKKTKLSRIDSIGT